MKRWPTKPLGKICELVNGAPFKPSDWDGAGLPIIRIQNLNNRAKPFNHTSKKLAEKFRVRPGDTLLSWSGTPGTSFGCFRWEGPEGWLNQHIFNVRLSDEVLPPFFIHQVNSKLQEIIGKAHGGVGLQHITKGALSAVTVSVPPLAEQERIIKLLDEADELRKLRAKAHHRTTNLIPAIFHEMFGDPDTNPMGWSVVTVGDLVQPIEFGISEALSKGCEYQPGRIAVLRIANITAQGTVDYGDLRYLKVSDKKRSQLLLHKGDLLFNWRNSPNWVGKTAIFDNDEPCIFASFLFRLRVVEDAVDRIFLWFYFNHLRRNGFFESKCRQAVSQANFGRDELAAVRIILPPLSLQREFAQRVKTIHEFEAAQATSRSYLDALFQSALHRAFNGEL